MMFSELQAVIEPTIIALGYELWGCEWVNLSKNTRQLRVYIESEQGVNIDDCAKVSRQISAILDVEDLIQGSYLLEVSSPGLERPLFTLAQCQRFVGQPVLVRLRVAKNGRRNFGGILEKVMDESIILVLEDKTEQTIPWRDIDKAHLKFVVSKGKKT
ncbi:MAG: ribosome maturation factor RimP [Proteobacteria bacterium]|nr:ribosome maturation factor RimP [Pseudomonadota bacterium]